MKHVFKHGAPHWGSEHAAICGKAEILFGQHRIIHGFKLAGDADRPLQREKLGVFFETEEPIDVVFLLTGDGDLQFIARYKKRSQWTKTGGFTHQSLA